MDRMMSTPVEKPNSSSALQVPETLLNILNYLENDRGTLYNVLQVNRMWFECGVSVLWKMVKFKRLQGAGKENRPFYASKIHYLLFEGDVAHEDFKDLEFSNLRIISIDSYRPKDGNIYLTQYLRPTLERIQIYGTDLNEEFLSTMEKCRRVKEFLLDSPGDRVTAERFLSFLQNCPSLDNLQFKYGMEKVINDDTVVYLAGKDNLRSLGLGPELTVKALDRALETVPTPFKHVESLDIKLSSAALRLLLPHLSQVQDLELTIKDNDRSVLVQLSALKALRSLAVSYACIADLTSSEILSLNQLKNLETLTLTGSDEDMEPNHLDCFQFTDDDLDTLLSQLPRLKTLQFGLQTMMTSNALQIVAKYCPLLNTLQLFVPIKLSTILPESPDAKPMLPKLISLDIADFECPNDVSIKDKEA